jgi:hypothetical protein
MSITKCKSGFLSPSAGLAEELPSQTLARSKTDQAIWTKLLLRNFGKAVPSGQGEIIPDWSR